MITTNIVIPTWLSVVDEGFYNALVRNVSYFNQNNNIISNPPIPPDTTPDPAEVWLGLFTSLVDQLENWRTTDRGWRAMIYALTTMGFDLSAVAEAELINNNGRVNFDNLSMIDTEIVNLMNESKFTNIFNFQGLVEESKNWPDSYILNGNNYSNLTYIVAKIAGSPAFENLKLDEITHNMTHLLQVRALNKMLENDPSKQVYFDYIGALPLYLIDTAGYTFPSTKP